MVEQRAFRNQKGYILQNGLGVVDFNLCFTFVLVGWEGSAHDGRVLLDAIAKGLFVHLGRYYLGDAGYAWTRYCLTPYRGVRYHLREWAAPGFDRPQNAKELYNLRHASLRNVVERAFGIVKKRFPIFISMPSYPFILQMELVKCCFMIHNFLRQNQTAEDYSLLKATSWMRPSTRRCNGFF